MFMEAMQAQSVHTIKRMKEMTLVMQTPKQVLEAQGITPADLEGTALSCPLRLFFFSLMKKENLYHFFLYA